MYLREYKKAYAVILRAHKEGKPLIVFDTETEGLDSSRHKIIQLSAYKVDPYTLDILEELDELIEEAIRNTTVKTIDF